MKNIGLLSHEAQEGKEVYYYSFYSDENESNSEPIKTKITSKIHVVSGQVVCFVEGVSGVVGLSHLSFEYYSEYCPKPVSKQKQIAKERYRRYSASSDCWNSFRDFLGHIEWERKGNQH